MSTKNLILLIFAGIVLAIAVTYYGTHSDVKAEIPRQIKVDCACLACRQHVRLEEKTSAPRPYVCSQCGERAAYPLLVCHQCGKHFVPELVRREGSELPAMPVMPACPSCGATNVGGYSGDELIPSEDLLLPQWPQ